MAVAEDSAIRPAGPFSLWERSIAFRYLRARRREGGITPTKEMIETRAMPPSLRRARR